MKIVLWGYNVCRTCLEATSNSRGKSLYLKEGDDNSDAKHSEIIGLVYLFCLDSRTEGVLPAVGQSGESDPSHQFLSSSSHQFLSRCCPYRRVLFFKEKEGCAHL